MLIALAKALTGAVVNRFRGGGVVLLPGETQVPDHKKTQVRRITYAATGAAFVFAHTFNPWQALGTFLVLWATLLTGWGVPIGAAGGWQKGDYHDFKEFSGFTLKIWRWQVYIPLLDDFATWLTDKLGGGNRTWGVVWLSCWGLFTGFLLALTGAGWLAMLTFGLIGAVYWSVFTFYLWRGRAAAEGWEIAELAFGFVSFLGLAT